MILMSTNTKSLGENVWIKNAIMSSSLELHTHKLSYCNDILVICQNNLCLAINQILKQTKNNST